MRKIIASAFVATALIAGGPAFANSSDLFGAGAAPTDVVVFAAGQASARTAAADRTERVQQSGRDAIQGAVSQGFAPVDTMNLSNGSAR
jgi:hypothetical protein